jgi:tetratricopeptide (TPR) repeat protein
LYLNRRYLDDWIESSEIGAAAARRARNEQAEARLRSVVSRAYTEIGDYDRARKHLDVALTLADRSDNKVLSASVWEFIGRFRDAAEPELSAEAYEQAIHRNDEAGERRGMAIATYFLGCAMSSRGDQTAALPILKRARRLLEEIDDQRMAGRGSISIGLAHLRCGNAAEARAELSQAVDFFSSSEAAHYEAQAREALADVAVEAGDPEMAKEQLLRVLDIRKASGAPDVAALQERLRRLHA